MMNMSNNYTSPYAQAQDRGNLPLTVSEDHSDGSSAAQRSLIALADRTKPSGSPQVIGGQHSGNHALSDYQSQLMLLEQQNKKRLIMARQEQARNNPPQQISNSSSQDNPQPTTFDYETHMATPERQHQTLSPSTSSHLEPSGHARPVMFTPTDLLAFSVDELRQYIEHLHGEMAKSQNSSSAPKPLRPRYEIMHRIKSKVASSSPDSQSKSREHVQIYLDAPQWIRLGDAKPRIASNAPVHNMELYMERNKDVSFIIYRDYDAETGANSIDDKESEDSINTDLPPTYTTEMLCPIRKDLVTAIKKVLGSQKMFSTWKTAFESDRHLLAPYYFVYHMRNNWESLRETLTEAQDQEIVLLIDYVVERHGKEHADVDRCIQSGVLISPQVMYFFKPGQLVVSTDGNNHVGHVTSNWPKYTGIRKISPTRSRDVDQQLNDRPNLPSVPVADAKSKTLIHIEDQMVDVHEWELPVWNWKFTGSFRRDQHTLWLRFPATKSDAERWRQGETGSSRGDSKVTSSSGFVEMRINELEVYPLTHAAPYIATKLQKRGETLWKCRKARIVSYKETGGVHGHTVVEERYIIDMQTFRSLHKDNIFNNNNQIQMQDDIGSAAMAASSPPDEEFSLLVQPKVKGYHLRLKKWYELEIDNISDVTWNQQAFESLVIDRKSKDLILALVTHQIAAQHATDVIPGKGNGLILLLHGGPGTGKTLTAESVAELAQKPLYRVTCGDVGTKAEDVEKYLESVFHLGKIWDCVVLLDEADVFLEQRSLNDLERNALVSVFLRVLEYYEGILILTSNRVGTFDEAFKSRIQLALHYPTLQTYQRRCIWKMFIDRLDGMEVAPNTASTAKIDTDDLRAHLDDLQAQQMNGRQIRNAITTARQYALFKKATMNYEHLKDVIEVAGRFDKYIDDLNHGYSLDELAQGEGLRLA